jgi:hypothetical protein
VSNRPTSGSSFTREFIADSSLLARYEGGVGLNLLSRSFSFPELLAGFPMAHPSPLPLFTGVWKGSSANFALTEFYGVRIH